MAGPVEVYVDPTAGNDHAGATFTNGSFANATNTLTKVGAFPAATCKVGAWLSLSDNGSGEVTAGYYRVTARTSDDAVVLHADIRSGANDPTDVCCTLHDGTAPLPWKSLQFALNQTTQAATGNRFNVLEGAGDNIGEVLLATLTLTAYGTPTEAKPLIIQGCTATAGDGGIGEIDGGGSYGCFAADKNFISVIDMEVHNGGSAVLLNLYNYCTAINCKVHNSTGALINAPFCHITGCNVYDGSSVGINNASILVAYNYIANSTKSFTSAIGTGNTCTIIKNIISVGGATIGITLSSDTCEAINNTILSAGGTGTAIQFSTATKYNRTVMNNYIEGFSGGQGVDFASVSEGGTIYRNNAFYNNGGNDEVDKGDMLMIDKDNQTALAASAIDKTGDNTFANRFTYFAPSATIRGDAYPSGSNLDIGAVQHTDPAGGGGGIKIAGRGGLA